MRYEVVKAGGSYDREDAVRRLTEHLDGRRNGTYQVEVKLMTDRSSGLLRYYWACVGEVAAEMGQTQYAVDVFFRRHVLGAVEVTMGSEVYFPARELPRDNGELRTYVREFRQAVLDVTGMLLKDPEEKMWE